MPFASDAGAAVIGKKIYVVTSGTKTEPAGVFIFDPARGIWTKGKPMRVPRLELTYGVAAVDGKLYVISGATNDASGKYALTDVVEVYDPATDTWSDRAPLPARRIYMQTGVSGGRIYAIGGHVWSPGDKEAQVVPDVDEYDPKTNSWRKITELPDKHFINRGFVVGNRICVIDPRMTTYEISHGKWSPFIRNNSNKPRGDAALTEWRGKVLVIGGSDTGRGGLTEVEEYDPVRGEWKLKPGRKQRVGVRGTRGALSVVASRRNPVANLCRGGSPLRGRSGLKVTSRFNRPLRDWMHLSKLSRHFVPGYYHRVRRGGRGWCN